MLRHFFSMSLASFRKAPFATLTNVTTLAIGLVSFVVAYGLVAFWARADEHLTHNSDRTFAIASRSMLADGSLLHSLTPGANEFLAQYLRTDFPELEAVARARPLHDDAPIAAGERTALLNTVSVDPEFSTIFALPFVAGDASTALSHPGSVVLTQDAAARLFGSENPLGKTVSFANRIDATVTGVIAPIPEPSHFGRSFAAILPFDVLTSMDVFDRYSPPAGFEQWFGCCNQTYVLLPADGSLRASTLEASLSAFVARHAPESQLSFGDLQLSLTPISKLLALNTELVLGGDLPLSTSLLLFGALILGVACVNYASVATALVARRARDAGVRKAIGARPSQIMLQHLLEAGLQTTVALVIAVVAARAVAPVLARYTGVDLGLSLSVTPRFALFVVSLVLAVTMLAGAYPALVLSRIHPIAVLRPAHDPAKTRLLSKTLVGLQFSVASFFLILVIVVYEQNEEVERNIAATAAAPVLAINNDTTLTGVAPNTLAAELGSLPGVEAVTLIDQPLAATGGSVVSRTADPADPRKDVAAYGVSYDFTRVFGLELVAGRAFDRAQGGDAVRSADGQSNVLIDRALAHSLGFSSPADAVDQLIYLPASFTAMFGIDRALALRVIGVVETKSFSILGDADEGGGTLYQFVRGPYAAVARLRRDEVSSTVRSIDALWSRLAPGIAVNRKFLDDIYDREYSSYARLGYGVRALTLFAVLISAASLFALGLVVAARRKREIAVRKSLGATSKQVLLLLIRDFSVPVIIANLIAWPVAYMAAERYVSMFVNRIAPGIPLFVASLGLTLAVAWVAVGAQSVRAARANPARSLRVD
ncbi:MAG TPA: ABC transporter permease [Gammaproteobacteria bacterium]|nr:ABC transporter permease [Gammaproteobacteria bacterium]